MPQLRDSSSYAPLENFDTSFERIFGIETEYGVSLTGVSDGERRDAAAIAALMFDPVIRQEQSTNTYVENGSRLYLDVGAHPEYATAEARTVGDAALLDAAGDALMRSLAQEAEHTLNDQLKNTAGSARIHVYKNNTDSQGSSFGRHENYLLRRSISLPFLDRAFIPFLVTRQIFAGAGVWREGNFEISQRAQFLDDTISSATTRSRPMINTRDESHADSRQYRRLHVIVGDSNRSSKATWLTLMTSHLVLCALEDESRRCHTYAADTWPALVDAGAEIKSVSRDINLKHTLELRDGRKLTALEIQRFYYDVVYRFMANHADDLAADIRADAHKCLNLWKCTLISLDTQQWSSLSPWVDWIAKYQLTKAMQERGAHPVRLSQIDFAYHDIVHDDVLAALRTRGMYEEIFSAERIKQAMITPPSGTRAELRSKFIMAAKKARARWSADWSSLTVLKDNNIAGATVKILDPFETAPSEQFIELLHEVTSSQTQYDNPMLPFI